MKFCLFCGMPIVDGPCKQCAGSASPPAMEQTTVADIIEKLSDTMAPANAAQLVANLLRPRDVAIATLKKALKALITDADRMCATGIGGTSESDCRYSISYARLALSALPEDLK